MVTTPKAVAELGRHSVYLTTGSARGAHQPEWLPSINNQEDSPSGASYLGEAWQADRALVFSRQHLKRDADLYTQ